MAGRAATERRNISDLLRPSPIIGSPKGGNKIKRTSH